MFRKIRRESSRIILLASVLVMCLTCTAFASVETAALNIQKITDQSGQGPVEAVVLACVATTQQTIMS